MKKDQQFNRVDPAQRAKVLRRVAVLREFCAIEKPKAADREAAAAALGIGIAQLYNLARAWRATRNPNELPGAQVHGGREAKRAKLDPGIAAVVDRIAADHATDAVGQVSVRARAALDEMGFEEISRRDLWKYVRQALRRVPPRTLFPEHTALVALSFLIDAQIRDGEAMVPPVVSLTLHAPSRRVLSWQLSARSLQKEEIVRLLIEGLNALGPDERAASRLARNIDLFAARFSTCSTP